MVIDQAISLKTDAELLNVIKKTAAKKPSAQELIEQRVSYVFGLLDDDSPLTKEQVRKVILEHVGTANT